MRFHVITTIYRNTGLLAQFIQHYLKWGFTDFHLLVNVMSGSTSLVDQVRDTVKNFPQVSIFEVYHERRDADVDAGHALECQRQRVSPQDWLTSADLDEFHQFPYPLQEIVDRCLFEADPQPLCVYGKLVDRVTGDGSLPELNPLVPVADQFPSSALVTQTILGGSCDKIMLQPGGVNLSSGHHNAYSMRPFLEGRPHHFKWHAQIFALVRERLEILKAIGYGHWVESERLVRYLEKHKRLVVEAPEMRLTWEGPLIYPTPR